MDNKVIENTIFQAIDQLNLDMIRQLIQENTNFNVLLMGTMAPLSYAVLKKSPVLVSTLLKSDNIDVNFDETFFYALRDCHLHYKNKDTHQKNMNVIFQLMNHSSFEIETMNDDQETYLYQACFYSLENIAIELISKGANIKAYNKFNETIYSIASQKQLHQVLATLNSCEEKDILENRVGYNELANKTHPIYKVKI